MAGRKRSGLRWFGSAVLRRHQRRIRRVPGAALEFGAGLEGELASGFQRPELWGWIVLLLYTGYCLFWADSWLWSLLVFVADKASPILVGAIPVGGWWMVREMPRGEDDGIGMDLWATGIFFYAIISVTLLIAGWQFGVDLALGLTAGTIAGWLIFRARDASPLLLADAAPGQEHTGPELTS